ncbi:MAG: tetratricopeptide repeat protein [Myxococcales bacterium]|nr:tetratricopeptide repeat protein [Myxococcales bacterium]
MTSPRYTPPEKCPRCQHAIPRSPETELAFCLNCRFPLKPIAGKYRLMRQLGKGGTGTVYLAKHIYLKRQAERVIKVVPLDQDAQTHQIERFEQEIQVTAILSQQNEHIVRIYDDFGHEPELGYYYVMEYLEGRSLRELLIQRERLSPAEAIHITTQLCLALQFAHTEDIIHRDLKPENILLIERNDDPSFVKLIDFGIAHLLQSESADGPAQVIVGTPLYMAPEQCLNRTIDARTDLYAVGVVLYEMLTGQHPFLDMHNLEAVSSLSIMFAQVWNAPPSAHERFPGLQAPKKLDEVLTKILAKDPAERFQSAQEMAIAVQRAAQDDEWKEAPPSSPRSSVPSRPPQVHHTVTENDRSKASTDDYAGRITRVQEEPIPVSQPTLDAAPSSPHELLPSAGEFDDNERAPFTYRTLLSAQLASLPRPKLIKTNLRQPHKSFIGRKQELQDLNDAFGHGERLVTLLGPGGTGKTSIAKHYGLQHIDDFEGGVWFCDLSECHSLGEMLQQIAATFQINLQTGEIEKQINQIGYALTCRGQALLIFDNFEQLTAHALGTLGRWFQEDSRTCFLVTSREKLQLQGEICFHLPPLPEDEAVQLFLDRARSLRTRWQPTKEELQVIEKIVKHLDRLPLAIELAAARIDVLSPQTLYEKLQQRFQVLSHPSQGIPARQATLRGAIDWSWDLLSDAEREAFAQCAIFRGGFTFEAAEHILQLKHIPDAPPTLDLIQALRNKSLLYPIPTEHPNQGLRLGMYESIREYAKERFHQSAQRGDVAAMHASYYLALGEALVKGLHHADGLSKLRYLLAESENLQAIFDRYIPHDPNVAMRTLLILQPALERSQTQDTMLQMLQLVMGQHEKMETPLYLKALRLYGEICRRMGYLEEAEESLHTAIKHAQEAQDALEEAQAQLSLGHLRSQRRQHEEAEATFRLALSYFEQHKEEQPHLLADAYNDLGSLFRRHGSLEEAEPFHLKALSLQRQHGDSNGEAITLGQLGHLYRLQGRYHEAIHVYDLALSLHRAWEDRHGEGITLNNLANIHARQGRLAEAELNYRKSLELHRAGGDRRGEAIALGQLGNLLLLQGKLTEAEKMQGQARALHEALHDPKGVSISINNLANLYRAQARFVEAADLYAQAKDLQQQYNDRVGLAFTSLFLALLYLEQQPEHPELPNLLNHALEYFSKRQQQQEFHGQVLATMGIWYGLQGRHLESLQFYQKALPCFRHTDARLDAWTRAAIGGLRADLGELMAAEQVLLHAGETIQRLEDPIGKSFVSLCRARLDLAFRKEALRHNDTTAAQHHLVTARQRMAEAQYPLPNQVLPTACSTELRIMLHALQKQLPSMTPPPTLS